MNGDEKRARCPICGKDAIEIGPFRPFCSERCSLIDLYGWFGESYRIATADRLDRPEDESTESANKGVEGGGLPH